MSNNELHKILGARFKEHTHSTDEAVWSAIEAHLDEKQKDRSGIWFWLLNGTAIILICTAMQWSVPSVNPDQMNNVEIVENINGESSNKQNNPSQKESTANQGESTSIASIRENNEKMMEYDRQHSPHSEKQPIYIGAASNLSLESIPPFPSFRVINGENEDENESKNNQRDDEGRADISVDALPPIDLLVNYSTGAEAQLNYLRPTTSRNYFKNLPIYVGVEFSYLKRQGSQADSPISALANLDTSYVTANSQLAFNRHYEMSAFVQFDFTPRFTASAGIGYSNSAVDFAKDTSASFTSSLTTITEKSSEMHLLTVPIQARFNFLQKNRFGLNGGLTIQSEFGRIKHNKTTVQESSTTSTPQPNNEALETSQANTFKLRQVAFEPFVQLSFSLSPRVSLFGNLGYKMYLNQSDNNVAPLGRLHYYNADFGMLFRLK